MTDRPGDHARVCELLGREPRGAYEIVVRDAAGDPVVLRNAPLLDDGTPMPTRYWLIGPDEIRRIGRLESAGGVDRAEREVDAAELAAAHDRYAAEREAEIPAGHTGPRPSGGVGGTRTGVKCLHAHWAWHLAGGDDPVGRWIEQELEFTALPLVEIGTETIGVWWDGSTTVLATGTDPLLDRWLRDGDPPHPAALTNALGEVTDHLDDVVRLQPGILEARRMRCRGVGAWAIARLESGLDAPEAPFEVDREAIEDVFRLAVTESGAEREHNPGLASGDVEIVLASLCVVVATMRRLGLGSVAVLAPHASQSDRG